jgi:formate dehydrogenase iron-sulfur subunit
MADKAILVDTTRCMACRGCQVACKQWNNLPAAPTKRARGYDPGGVPKWLWFQPNEFFAGAGYQNPAGLDYITYRLVKFLDCGTTGDDVDAADNWHFLGFSCMHCMAPLCVEGCQWGAIVTDGDGFKRIKKKVCKNNNKTCTASYTQPPPCRTACPFDVPRLGKVKSKGTWTKFARKCNGCFNRRSKPYPYPTDAAGNTSQYQAGDNDIESKSFIGPDLIPACVSACPTGALQYGGRAAVLSAAAAIAADPNVLATYPGANVYGKLSPNGGLRVISVLTKPPAFYGLPT